MKYQIRNSHFDLYYLYSNTNIACVKYNVQLIFGQTGNIFIKDGKEYKIRNRTEQMVQALRSGLHYPPVNIDDEIQKIYDTKEKLKKSRK